MALFLASLVAWCQGLGIGSSEKGRNIISDMARNTDPNAKIRDIVNRNVTESANRIINKLSGQGRKRNRATSVKRGGGGNVKRKKKQPKSKKKGEEYKTGNFILTA